MDYNIGPSPKSVQLNLMNLQEYVTTPLWNVIGVINGTIPDEVVILGNHRDAWIAGGAGDPNSGSAALNEVIRSIGEAMKAGWKPLRTIVFASWDGEEYGLIGSTEWVEEFVPWLAGSTIAYLNVDVGARGPHFDPAASPMLNRLIYNITSAVKSPNQTVEGQSVRDTWNGYIRTMGSGSDFTAFQDFVGIPSADYGFRAGPKDPVYHYHSNYDSFYWMDHFGDKSWHYHVTMAKILALTVATVSESPVLPLNATDHAHALGVYLKAIEDGARPGTPPSTNKSADLSSATSKFDFKSLHKAAHNYLNSSIQFDAYAADLAAQASEGVPWWKWWKRISLYLAIKKTNSQLKLLERQFIFPEGLDGRPWFKHVVFAPGRWTGYAGSTFPGIVESLEDKNMTNARRWSDIVVERLEAAATSLQL